MNGDGSGPAGNPNGMRGMGGMFEESSGYLTITGGKLYVNSGGDGLDANTDIKQTGGENNGRLFRKRGTGKPEEPETRSCRPGKGFCG